MPILHKGNHRFNSIPSKMSVAFFTEIEQTILKFLFNHKRSQIAKNNFQGIEEQNWRQNTYWFQNILQSYSNQNSIAFGIKKCRSMEQCTKPRKKCTQVQVINLQWRCQKYTMRIGQVFNDGVRKTGWSRANEWSSVQSLRYVRLFATPWTAAHQGSLSITNSRSLLRLMSIESRMSSNRLILCHALPSMLPSIRVFSNESVHHIRRPKDWSFSFSIIPSNKYSWLISFRIVWLDLLAGQGTLKSLKQHYSSKASILQCSAFFIDQLSHPYMTMGKTVSLTRRIFVGKAMSLLFFLICISLFI